jgi:hypothetical protein
MGMQITRTHETCLGRMRMDPAKNHEIFLINVIEKLGFIGHFARIGRTLLFGNDQFGNEEGVGNESTTEHAACFQISLRIGTRDAEESASNGWRDENRS